MTTLDSGRTPEWERSTPKEEKPGAKPGFRNNKNEVQSTTLPPYKKVAQFRALLRERHSVIQNCLPLAIGIHEAILTAYPEQGKTAIRRALQFHTTSSAYLKNLAAGGHRYDLTGQPLGLVTPEHQQQAREKLIERRQASKKERPASKPTPHGSPASNTTPVDAAAPDAVIQRLKETRPRLMLKRKEGRL